MRSHLDEDGLYPDWSPGGQRQRGIEPDQGDYSTMFEHLMPTVKPTTPSSNYAGVLRSVRRTMEYRPERDGIPTVQTMPDRGSPISTQTMEDHPPRLSERDLQQYEQNLVGAVNNGRMDPRRAQSLLQAARAQMTEMNARPRTPRLGDDLGQTAQAVTGQTTSIIDNLLRPQNRPVAAPRPQTTQGTPRTAREAYERSQQQQVPGEREQRLAAVRERLKVQQAGRREKIAAIRERIMRTGLSQTVGESGTPRDPGIKEGMSDLEIHARQEAARLGIDPEMAVRVGNTEGGFADPTRQNTGGAPAYGPYQMHVGGPEKPGLGDEMIRLGMDPRKPENAKKAITFALEHAKKNGWGAFQGAAANGINEWDGIDRGAAPVAQAVNSGVTVQQQQRAASSGKSVWELGSLTPNQLTEGLAQGLDRETALAVCGPAAAIAFARKNGRNPSLPEALQMAKEVGWTLQNGMAGPASQVQLLKRMGIAATLEDGPPDAAKVAAQTQAGNPVTISTPGHYFVAEQYDPSTGKFNFGESAKVLKASKGNAWYTLDEIAKLGMGAPRAAIYMQGQ